MRIRWLHKALHNLDEEATYIATDDEAAARLGAGRPGRVPGTRELVVPNTRYILPYRFRGETIEVLRVFHASRRPPQRG